MTWNCAAIDHGVTIFPQGKIGPCCQISADYLKSISQLRNPDRFVDLHTNDPPEACKKCVQAEHLGLKSYRQMFNNKVKPLSGLQFVDIRNTNYCNLKCRYCGPHFSNQWADELGLGGIVHTPISQYQSVLITDSLQWMYFTGGEPLISSEHWNLLEDLSIKGQSKNIELMYNTNLTTIKYKDKQIVDLWKNFKSVNIQCSIDAVGEPLEYIRSGASWDRIKSNLEILHQQTATSNIKLTIAPVLSILNIWFVEELFKYADQHNIPTEPILLTGPDYLAVDVIPDELTALALECVERLTSYISPALMTATQDKIKNNINSCLFLHTLNHVMLLDNIRGEKLFELLPFKDIAKNIILKNQEYE